MGVAQFKLGHALLAEKRYADAEQHTLAGHKILIRKTGPNATGVQSARQDLTEIYEKLDQPGSGHLANSARRRDRGHQ